MDIPSIEEIRQMSPEEIRETNSRLGRLALKRMLLRQGVKWGLIIGATYAARKWIESLPETTEETE